MDFTIENIRDTVNNFRNLCVRVQEMKRTCEDEQSEADLALSDIRHYCELNTAVSRSDKTKVFRLTHEWSARRRRRRICSS